jgi:hypothetical protein
VWRPYNLTNHQLLESMQVHIPVSSGDGYFRLRVTPHDKPRETVSGPWMRTSINEIAIFLTVISSI